MSEEDRTVRIITIYDRIVARQLDALEAALDGKVEPMVANPLTGPMTIIEQALRLRMAWKT